MGTIDLTRSFLRTVYDFLMWIVENHKSIINIIGIVSTLYFIVMVGYFSFRFLFCSQTGNVMCLTDTLLDFFNWLFAPLYLANNLAKYGFWGSISAIIVIFFWGNKFKKSRQ